MVSKIRAKEEEVKRLDSASKEFEPELRDLRRALRTAQQSSKDLKLDWNRAQMKVGALKDELDAVQPSDNTRIAVLEAEINVTTHSLPSWLIRRTCKGRRECSCYKLPTFLQTKRRS